MVRKRVSCKLSKVQERESKQHPDRNRQFEYIQEQEATHQADGQPVIGVDTKKKELVGNFKDPGPPWLLSSPIQPGVWSGPFPP
jgi:hypothetical protein